MPFLRVLFYVLYSVFCEIQGAFGSENQSSDVFSVYERLHRTYECVYVCSPRTGFCSLFDISIPYIHIDFVAVVECDDLVIVRCTLYEMLRE